jgi:hypothetical chaperone protein
MSQRVGLDFGTSNSGVALVSGGKVHVLPLDPDNLVPEVVKTILYVTRDGQAYVGQEAVALYYEHNVGRPRSYVKKWVGEVDYHGGDMHYVRDVYTYVDELAPGRLLQYLKTALRTTGYEGTRIFERFYSPADLAGLRSEEHTSELKARAEARLGEDITAVVLGRPVKLAADPRQDRRAEEALRQAAEQAGFARVNFELEPVAAALDYEQRLTHPQDVLVFDFGGGTLDITVMHLGEPGRRTIYAAGGVDVAGSDFDRTIIHRRMLKHFGQGQVEGDPALRALLAAVEDWMALPEQSTPTNRHRLRQAMQDGIAPRELQSLEALIFDDLAFSFYRAVEEAKIILSNQGAAVIRLEERGLRLWELYTRAQFEQDIRIQRARIRQVLLETLQEAGREPGQIDAVVTTGGSASIPVFRQLLAELFGAQKLVAADAFRSVVAGLALRGGA